MPFGGVHRGDGDVCEDEVVGEAGDDRLEGRAGEQGLNGSDDGG